MRNNRQTRKGISLMLVVALLMATVVTPAFARSEPLLEEFDLPAVEVIDTEGVHLVSRVEALQEAIDEAEAGDTILLADNLNGAMLPDTLEITKSLTIQAEHEPVILYPPAGSQVRHIHLPEPNGRDDAEIWLRFTDVILDGRDAGGTPVGGGIKSQAQNLKLENVVLQNCTANSAALLVSTPADSDYQAQLTITGSGTRIADNKATQSGGGVSAVRSTLIMEDGVISGNYALDGGGVSLHEAVFYLRGGLIGSEEAGAGNSARDYGAGVYVHGGSTMVMEGGAISGNWTTGSNGGGAGVYVSAANNLEMKGGTISGNVAKAGTSGGGVQLGTLTHVVGDEPGPSYFTMSGGTIENNVAGVQGGGVALMQIGYFTMTGGTISGNTAGTYGGGGVMLGRATLAEGVHFTMTGGEISDNTGPLGGGVVVEGKLVGPTTFTMTGGVIKENIANYYGAGISVVGPKSQLFLTADAEEQTVAPVISGNQTGDAGSNFGGGVSLFEGAAMTMNDGQITGNTAETAGGGLALISNDVTCTINGGEISDNESPNGGGIYLMSGAAITLTGGDITENRAYVHGGGMYATATSQLEINGPVRIAKNQARQEGGGIYTADYTDYENLTAEDYQNISVGAETIFAGNTANALYEPPTGVAELFPNLRAAAVSEAASLVTVHPLNNFDINYVHGEPVEIKRFSVTYHANGGTGTILDSAGPYAAASEVTVLAHDHQVGESTGFSYSGYTFQHWNTAADGSGMTCQADETFLIKTDTDLYAIWKQNPGGGGGGNSRQFTVIYDGNGGQRSNGTSQYRVSVSTTRFHVVLDNGDANLQFARPDHTFRGWSTSAAGSVKVEAGQQLTGRANEIITLYALWDDEETPYVSLNRDDHLGYIQGYPDGSVRPERELTRGEAAAIFYRLTIAEDKGASYQAGFHDLNTSDWYYDDVAYMTRHGIIVGYEDGTFRGEAPITRAELSTIASKFDDLALGEENLFNDVPATHWALAYVNSAARKGWVNGYPDGTFKPDANITRAETVTLINRVLDRLIELSDLPAGVKKYTDLTTSHWAYCDLMEASHTHDFERKVAGELAEIWRDGFTHP